eukprot:XP_011665670.1 PREDICTED: uncharacterized protein LOC105438954 [Strongylocentrotus purpuratus]
MIESGAFYPLKELLLWIGSHDHPLSFEVLRNIFIGISRSTIDYNIALYTLTSLAIMFFVVIVLLIFHYRWQLRYKLFLLKLAAVGYNEMRDARDHNDYEFDMNVIFYDDDEEWARERLLPTLEERLPQFERNPNPAWRCCSYNTVGSEEIVLSRGH